jgi:hypothetical protein
MHSNVKSWRRPCCCFVVAHDTIRVERYLPIIRHLHHALWPVLWRLRRGTRDTISTYCHLNTTLEPCA